MIELRVGDLAIFQFERLLRYPQVIHGIPSRLADPARFPRGLDLSFVTSPSEADAVAARAELCSALGLRLEDVVSPRQVHGNEVADVSRGECGRGAFRRESGIAETDGLTTATPGVGLLITAADCVPLLFFDPVRRAIGVSHAGWRGTVARIGTATVMHMSKTYGCRPADILAGIGPSIGPCCYSVGEDVITEVVASFEDGGRQMVSETDGRRHLDLWRANQIDLLDAGIQAGNLEVARICTACRTDLFFSHRAEKDRAGRFGAIMALRDEQEVAND